jgi:hypothetical protein
MSAFNFDSLAQVLRLEKVGFPREQSVAIVQSQQEMFEHAAVHTLATKSDLVGLRLEMSELRAELRQVMVETKTDIIKWVTGLMLAQAAVVSALVKLL